MLVRRVVLLVALIFALVAVPAFARDKGEYDTLKTQLQAALQGNLYVQVGQIPGQFALGGTAQHAVFDESGQMSLSGGKAGSFFGGFNTENDAALRKGESVMLKRVEFKEKNNVVRLVVATVNPREQVLMGTTRERVLQACLDFVVPGGLASPDTDKLIEIVHKVLAPENKTASH